MDTSLLGWLIGYLDKQLIYKFNTVQDCNRIQDIHIDIVMHCRTVQFSEDEIIYLPACF